MYTIYFGTIYDKQRSFVEHIHHLFANFVCVHLLIYSTHFEDFFKLKKKISLVVFVFTILNAEGSFFSYFCTTIKTAF